MTPRRLRRLIQAYGGEASRWPAAEREAALRLLAQSDEARTLQREAARLDRQLDGWAPAVEPGRAAQLLDAVSGRLKDSPFRLSGGQQQLLCLARALAIEPDVLLLDEPTSSLDPVATESIEALIRTLVPEITVVIVTHNLAQARRVSDDTVFLNKGRLVEHGATKQVFENPAEEETAHYVTGRFG